MPLPPELLEEIKKTIAEVEERIKGLDEDIRKAKLAGIDTRELEARQRELKDRLAKLKAAYL